MRKYVAETLRTGLLSFLIYEEKKVRIYVLANTTKANFVLLLFFLTDFLSVEVVLDLIGYL